MLFEAFMKATDKYFSKEKHMDTQEIKNQFPGATVSEDSDGNVNVTLPSPDAPAIIPGTRYAFQLGDSNYVVTFLQPRGMLQRLLQTMVGVTWARKV